MKTKLSYIILLMLVFQQFSTAQKVYKVKYESQADLKIYIVEYDSQAGWRNEEKMHLLKL